MTAGKNGEQILSWAPPNNFAIGIYARAPPDNFAIGIYAWDELINTYISAKSVQDLTYDGAHYKDIVGWTLATYMLHSLFRA